MIDSKKEFLDYLKFELLLSDDEIGKATLLANNMLIESLRKNKLPKVDKTKIEKFNI